MIPSTRLGRAVRSPASWLLVLCVLALLLGAYYLLRYDLNWVDGDTARINSTILAVRQGASYLPQGGYFYQHGFLYQVLSLFLMEVAGLDLASLQVYIWPLLSPLLLVLAAFVFYRRLARSSHVALLAALLLLFQGDVLFVILRGSHEKLDWPLMLLALAMLLHSLSSSLARRALTVALFYLLLFAMGAANVFFASVFVAALLVVLLLVWAVGSLHRRSDAGNHLPQVELRRLSILLLSSTVVVFIVMTYVYPPSLANVRMLGTIWDRLSALLLGFQPLENPYAYISFGWVSTGAYLGVSAFTWLLIAASFLVWCGRGLRLLRTPPRSWLADELDWLLYAGFAVVVAISILVDVSGILSRNMQLRVFPGFTVVAVLLLARALLLASPLRYIWAFSPLSEMSKIPNGSQEEQEGVEGMGARRVGMRKLARTFAFALLILLLPYFMLASLFKATNEPLLSNKWSFYTPAEVSTIRWSEAHLQEAAILTGVDDRLASAASFILDEPHNDYQGGELSPGARYLLSTDLEQERAYRLHIQLPSVLDWLRLYDSGQAQLYHQRPATPYQR